MSVNDTDAECRECGSYNTSYICIECVAEILNSIQSLFLEHYATPTEHRDNFLKAFRELKDKYNDE